METSRRWLSFAVCALVTGTAGAAGAQQMVFKLVTNDPAVHNHWPGTDALIGTGDDVDDGSLSSINQSAPNGSSSYSFNAFDFTGTGVVTDPWMPTGMNAMTFLQGTVTIDLAVAAAGGARSWRRGTFPAPSPSRGTAPTPPRSPR